MGYKTQTDILEEIKNDENLSLTKLSKKFKMSKQALNYHIRELKLAKLIKTRRSKGEILLILNKQILNKAINNIKNILI
ncbi:MAG: winged helix-turn-helix domain-containing protein [Alphaproteobacteria bacterium]